MDTSTIATCWAELLQGRQAEEKGRQGLGNTYHTRKVRKVSNLYDPISCSREGLWVWPEKQLRGKTKPPPQTTKGRFSNPFFQQKISRT